MTTKTAKSQSPNAIELLIEDHKNVKKLFKEFDKMKEQDSEEKAALVQQICTELTVHTQIEEEIFYPAVRDAIDDDDMMDEAEVEHASAKDLIAQLQSMHPEEALYDAKVTVLGEYVNHHVEEEEKEMFAKVKKAKLDLETLGEKMAAEKESLMAEQSEESDAPQAAEKPASKRKPKQTA